MCGRFFVFLFLFLTGRIGVFPVVRKTRQLEQEEKKLQLKTKRLWFIKKKNIL